MSSSDEDRPMSDSEDDRDFAFASAGGSGMDMSDSSDSEDGSDDGRSQKRSKQQKQKPAKAAPGSVTVTAAPEGPSVMDLFWELATWSPEARASAAQQLVASLEAPQLPQQDGDEPAPLSILQPPAPTSKAGQELQYAVKRLVRGLASSREAARPGFGAALAQLAASFPCLGGAELVQQFRQQVIEAGGAASGGASKRSERRELAISRVFFLLALLRGGRLHHLGLAELDAPTPNGLSEAQAKAWKKTAKQLSPKISSVTCLMEEILEAAWGLQPLRELAFTAVVQVLDVVPDAALPALYTMVLKFTQHKMSLPDPLLQQQAKSGKNQRGGRYGRGKDAKPETKPSLALGSRPGSGLDLLLLRAALTRIHRSRSGSVDEELELPADVAWSPLKLEDLQAEEPRNLLLRSSLCRPQVHAVWHEILGQLLDEALERAAAAASTAGAASSEKKKSKKAEQPKQEKAFDPEKTALVQFWRNLVEPDLLGARDVDEEEDSPADDEDKSEEDSPKPQKATQAQIMNYMVVPRRYLGLRLLQLVVVGLPGSRQPARVEPPVYIPTVGRRVQRSFVLAGQLPVDRLAEPEVCGLVQTLLTPSAVETLLANLWPSSKLLQPAALYCRHALLNLSRSFPASVGQLIATRFLSHLQPGLPLLPVSRPMHPPSPLPPALASREALAAAVQQPLPLQLAPQEAFAAAPEDSAAVTALQQSLQRQVDFGPAWMLLAPAVRLEHARALMRGFWRVPDSPLLRKNAAQAQAEIAAANPFNDAEQVEARAEDGKRRAVDAYRVWVVRQLVALVQAAHDELFNAGNQAIVAGAGIPEAERRAAYEELVSDAVRFLTVVGYLETSAEGMPAWAALQKKLQKEAGSQAEELDLSRLQGVFWAGSADEAAGSKKKSGKKGSGPAATEEAGQYAAVGEVSASVRNAARDRLLSLLSYVTSENSRSLKLTPQQLQSAAEEGPADDKEIRRSLRSTRLATDWMLRAHGFLLRTVAVLEWPAQPRLEAEVLDQATDVVETARRLTELAREQQQQQAAADAEESSKKKSASKKNSKKPAKEEAPAAQPSLDDRERFFAWTVGRLLLHVGLLLLTEDAGELLPLAADLVTCAQRMFDPAPAAKKESSKKKSKKDMQDDDGDDDEEGGVEQDLEVLVDVLLAFLSVSNTTTGSTPATDAASAELQPLAGGGGKTLRNLVRRVFSALALQTGRLAITEGVLTGLTQCLLEETQNSGETPATDSDEDSEEEDEGDDDSEDEGDDDADEGDASEDEEEEEQKDASKRLPSKLSGRKRRLADSEADLALLSDPEASSSDEEDEGDDDDDEEEEAGADQELDFSSSGWEQLLMEGDHKVDVANELGHLLTSELSPEERAEFDRRRAMLFRAKAAKADGALAMLFGGNRQLQKKQERQQRVMDLHFRFRVLDLLETYVQRQPRSPLLLGLLERLMVAFRVQQTRSAAEAGGKKKNKQQGQSGESVEARIAAVVRKLCNRLSVSDEQRATDGSGELLQMVQRTFDRARAASGNPQFVTLSAQCLVGLVRSLCPFHAGGLLAKTSSEADPGAEAEKPGKKKKSAAKELSPEEKQEKLERLAWIQVADHVRRALAHFLSRKQSGFNHLFFTELFNQLPLLGWSMLPVLLNLALAVPPAEAMTAAAGKAKQNSKLKQAQNRQALGKDMEDDEEDEEEDEGDDSDDEADIKAPYPASEHLRMEVFQLLGQVLSHRRVLSGAHTAQSGILKDLRRRIYELGPEYGRVVATLISASSKKPSLPIPGPPMELFVGGDSDAEASDNEDEDEDDEEGGKQNNKKKQQKPKKAASNHPLFLSVKNLRVLLKHACTVVAFYTWLQGQIRAATGSAQEQPKHTELQAAARELFQLPGLVLKAVNDLQAGTKQRLRVPLLSLFGKGTLDLPAESKKGTKRQQREDEEDAAEARAARKKQKAAHYRQLEDKHGKGGPKSSKPQQQKRDSQKQQRGQPARQKPSQAERKEKQVRKDDKRSARREERKQQRLALKKEKLREKRAESGRPNKRQKRQ